MSAPARAGLSGPVASLRQRLQAGRDALRSEYGRSPNAARFLREHSRLVDGVLGELWRDNSLPAGSALVAVGGYGRGELFPHSDVDLLVLLAGTPHDAERRTVEAFVGLLWDIGLEIGHSVRTVEQCADAADADITIRTTLLEARLLAGDRALFDALEQAVRSRLDVQRFFKAKRLEQEQRHEKFQDTPFSLEPNLKESPGGLRDLQVILWVSRAAGLGRDWVALAAAGLITPLEARQLKQHEELLRHARIRLHLIAGRREDRILFDHQDALAREFGIGAGTGPKRPSETFMQRYYRAAKAVTQLNTILLQNLGAAIFPAFDAQPEILNERFQSVRELLDARDPELFEREPAAILESFRLMQDHSS